jgi:hypothetical protein
MRYVTRASSCSFVLAIGVALTACGSNSSVTVSAPSGATAGSASAASNGSVPDATSLVHDARAAYKKATSAHVHATINDAGEVQTIDIKGSMDGTNQEMSITDPTSGHATVRTVNSKYYIKGDQDFWLSATKSNGTTAALLADKWVLSPRQAAASFRALTMRALLDEMLGASAITDTDIASMTTSRGSAGSKPVYVATSHDPVAEVSSVKVLADGTNDPAEVSGDSGDGSDGVANFDGWNTQTPVQVPKGYVSFPGSGGGATDGPSI